MKSGFRVSLFLILVFVFAPLGTAEADTSAEKDPLWKILMEIGDKKEESFAIWGEYIRFWKSTLYTLKIEEDTEKYWEKFRDGLENFDIENIHDMILYRHKKSSWKGIGFRGGRKSRSYRISLVDPHLPEWIDKQNLQWSKPLVKMGDFELKVFTSPHKTAEDEGTYLFQVFGRLNLGPVEYSNLLTGLDKAIRHIENRAHNPGTIDDNVKGDFPSLQSSEQALLSDLARDFPQSYKIVREFVDLNSLVESRSHKGRKFAKVNFDMRYKMEGLKKPYPHFYKYLKRISGLILGRARVYDGKGQLIALILFDTHKYRLKIQTLLDEGRFLPCTLPWDPAKGKGLSPLLTGSHNLEVRFDLKINLKGITVVLRNIRLKIHYQYDLKKGARLQVTFEESPVISKISGRAYGVIPLWFIDMVIPSNITSLFRQFFKIMAKGNNKKGSVTEISTYKKGETNRVELKSSSEVLNNGLIKIGLRIVNKVLLPSPQTQEEMLQLNKRIWHAFVADFLKYRFK